MHAAVHFEAPLLAIGDRLDELRLLLGHLDVQTSHPRSAELSQLGRAWTYVGLGAALEDYVRAFIDELTHSINRAKVPLAELRLGIVSLVQAPAFDSVATRRRQEKWDKRAAILKFAASTDDAELAVGLRPLDGRTLRPGHLESLWSVYELPGDPMPSALHAVALRDLSDGRNSVAHGTTNPASFGRSKAYIDVLRRIGHVEDIAIHIAAVGSIYLESQGYLR
jgi:hypothetical protein